ncbi:MAG: hydrogenase maturation protease [Geobacteraceae bacterium]|nr:hydrogenase maturation protease [Geobacteraceae bacterium]
MIVLVGYGNPLRRDDGAGPALARMVEAWGGRNDMRVMTPHQLVPELAEDLAEAGVAVVLFLDACVSDCDGGAMVAIRPVDGEARSPAFGHHFPPTDLLHYVKLLRGAPLPAWQLTIPGVDFGYGEGLSRYAGNNLALAMEKLQVFLRKIPLPLQCSLSAHEFVLPG